MLLFICRQLHHVHAKRAKTKNENEKRHEKSEIERTRLMRSVSSCMTEGCMTVYAQMLSSNALASRLNWVKYCRCVSPVHSFHL